MNYSFPKAPTPLHLLVRVESNHLTSIITVRNCEQHPHYAAVRDALVSQGWLLEPLEGDGFYLHYRDADQMMLGVFAGQIQQAFE